MQKKKRKTLYLPDWLIELLDAEDDAGAKPHKVAGAAILDFCSKDPHEKLKLLKRFAEYDLDATYGCAGSVELTNDAARVAANRIVPGSLPEVEQESPPKAKGGRKPKAG